MYTTMVIQKLYYRRIRRSTYSVIRKTKENSIKTTLLLLLLTAVLFAGPTTVGSNGLINVPSAFLYDDGEVVIQSQYLQAGYLHYKEEYQFVITTASIAFLPFMEITAGTSISVEEARQNRQAIGDRMVNLRFQILKEKEYRPAITIGSRDVLSVLGAQGGAKTTYYNSFYGVVTKSFTPGNHKIAISGGFGHPMAKTANHSQLDGFFGGVEWQPVKWVQLQTEYDARLFNCGVVFIPHKIVQLKITTAQFEAVSAGLSLHFALL